MYKYKETYGVDISKDVFDVHGNSNSMGMMNTGSGSSSKIFLTVRWSIWKPLGIIITGLHSFFTKTRWWYR